MRKSNTPESVLVSRVTATLADDEVTCPECSHKFALTETQANRVIVAYDTIKMGGEPLGVRKVGPAGQIALRVDSLKGPLWKIVQPDGGVIENMEPDLPADWIVLEPKGAE